MSDNGGSEAVQLPEGILVLNGVDYSALPSFLAGLPIPLTYWMGLISYLSNLDPSGNLSKKIRENYRFARFIVNKVYEILS